MFREYFLSFIIKLLLTKVICPVILKSLNNGGVLMDKMQSTARKLDVFFHIFQVALSIAAVASAVGIAIVAAFFIFDLKPEQVATGYNALDFGAFELKLAAGYVPDESRILLMKAADDAGILDQTDFFIVSDHGQMEIRRSVALNVFFAEKGLIDVDEKGEIRDWTAFAKSSGMSSQIYLKHPDCPEALARTKAVLDEMLASETAGISEVFTAQEAREKHHLAGDFSFVVETDNYTTFSNDWLRPVIKPLDNRNYRFGRATHGHLPHKGPQPTLVAFGPHIKPGVVLENALLVDEAPTFAHALGLKMENVDGRTLNELFND